jgi:carbonic anhydrase/acetyltransferase-like protein (isoleucine patch superfamily)
MSTTILPFRGRQPSIAPSAFIAPGARIVGDVRIGENASVWYNCVIRSDHGKVRIGARSNVQDGTVIHVTSGEWDTEIGDNVVIGHMALLHGCKLLDRSFVGLGAIVMDGCEIEPTGMLAAGGFLTPGKRIPSGQLWGGRPARYMRTLSPADLETHRLGVEYYVEHARYHAEAVSVDVNRQVEPNEWKKS